MNKEIIIYYENKNKIKKCNRTKKNVQLKKCETIDENAFKQQLRMKIIKKLYKMHKKGKKSSSQSCI